MQKKAANQMNRKSEIGTENENGSANIKFPLFLIARGSFRSEPALSNLMSSILY